jgi:hypothetical protein
MNRNMALWLGMAMGMGMEHEPTDSHCEKDGKHCTFLLDDGRCRLYDIPLVPDSEGHRRLDICKERNFVIGRTA